MKTRTSIALWVVVTAVLAAIFGAPFFAARGPIKLRHVPGAMSDGHHQIELACDACHEPFGGVRQDACTGCHAAELAEAKDSHPESKFADPRNAERTAKLDATQCTTCHREHMRERTRPAGLTQPTDFCGVCHGEIGSERKSHEGLAATTCTSSGCHNYHDNRALHESFLAKQLAAPPPVRPAPAPPAPRATPAHQSLACAGCHQQGSEFVLKPAHDGCRSCHETQAKGFDLGRHGMRAAAGLPAMRPADARLPMHASAAGRELGCTSCHDAHSVDTRRAATDACLGCHADEHSRVFPQTSHAAAGVTCATCHLPGGNHNQNDNLRPSTKMVRTVCLDCHGLGETLDALADPALVRENFGRAPTVHVRSLEMIEARQNRNR